MKLSDSEGMMKPPLVSTADLESFAVHLRSSTRILALLGAGLSASSGLPTFRGAGGLWRSHDVMSLATHEAFEANPGLVWQFYNHRRHVALEAKPNPAHYALAKLAKERQDGFMTLSQNVDGLSERAGHPKEHLQLLHGSLFHVKCDNFFCSYSQEGNTTDPIVPALGTSEEFSSNPMADLSDGSNPIRQVPIDELPHCPRCITGLLRPGVIWFGERLPSDVLNTVDDWIDNSTNIDLMLVIGTSATVHPAAGYIDLARQKGARVAVLNFDREAAQDMEEGDWFFEGDAAQILPLLLGDAVGKFENYSSGSI